jgi:hypothetical protein
VGDYWIIPARTITRDVEWPGPVSAPQFLPPHGIVHHYAPLAIVTRTPNNTFSVDDRRRWMTKLFQDANDM